MFRGLFFKMVIMIVFLAFGFLFASSAFDMVLTRTGNPILSTMAMFAVLAFWVGAFTVTVRIAIRR